LRQFEIASMIDWNNPIKWRFGMWQLLAAMTVNAAACGILVADFPGEFRALALCVLLFSIGIAILIGGAGLAGQTSFVVRVVGQVVMSLGFGLVAGAVVIVFIIALMLAAYYALRLAA
jgi:hypothetical protein